VFPNQKVEFILSSIFVYTAGSGAAWLARLPWEQEVGGSNPLSPIDSFRSGSDLTVRLKNAQLCDIVRAQKSHLRACSSVGQSSCLLSSGSGVRVSPGALANLLILNGFLRICFQSAYAIFNYFQCQMSNLRQIYVLLKGDKYQI
jgi:hypothetical protein